MITAVIKRLTSPVFKLTEALLAADGLPGSDERAPTGGFYYKIKYQY